MRYVINVYRTIVESEQVFFDTDKEDPKAEIQKAVEQIGGLHNVVALHGENTDEINEGWEWSGDVHETDEDCLEADDACTPITQDMIDGVVVWDGHKYDPVYDPMEEEEDEEEYE